MDMKDFGPKPYTVDLEELTLENNKFRQAIWTGEQLQMTLMSIEVDGEIGGEVHTKEDQFLRLEQGKGRVIMGPSEDNITFEEEVEDDFGIFIPKGVYHNVINIGDVPIKLYSIYAPPHHDHGTVHDTYEEAMEAEHDHDH